ncbi:MAG: DNA polymerase III subunit delta [Oscillibacter sp.]|nr:DNA polymerase III subunit delta [Oscillibacter sp.]
MAYGEKRQSASDAAYRKLKDDLKNGSPLARCYLFYGEESYLREHYLGKLRGAILSSGFEEFNYHAFEGKDLRVETLAEAVESMPMMAERTLTVVSDYDLFNSQMAEGEQEALIALLSDVPEYACLVFVYDALEYKQDKRKKRLCAALAENVCEVCFLPQSQDDLTRWIARRFRALDKEIDRRTAEYLIFLCGDLMSGLTQEIAKIAAYAKGPRVTQEDIDAIAEPVLSAEIFKMTDCVTQGDYDRAAQIMGDLLKMQEEPIAITAALGSQLRRLYTARLALDEGKDKSWLMEMWSMRSDYPAKLLLAAAARTSRAWCEEAVEACQTLDRRLKSERGIDDEGELKLFLVELGASR